MGRRNPTHVINRDAWPDGVSEGADGAAFIEDVSLIAGDRYPLLAIDAGEDDATGASAEAYRVWYQNRTPRRRQYLGASGSSGGLRCRLRRPAVFQALRSPTERHGARVMSHRASIIPA
jgi:hypothetical protein